MDFKCDELILGKTDADSRALTFYQAALAAGATDNGAPSLRPHYHPGYYAAFVYDPDGYNIEAVYHGGQPTTETP